LLPRPDSEPEVSADLLTELNAPDSDDEQADRPEEEVTEGIEQAVSPVLERRIEDMLAEGLKPSMATSLEMLDAGASGRRAIDEELESVRKRKVQLVEELKSLDDYLQDSKDYVGVNPPDINAISTGPAAETRST
jgi:hypothetical protein